MSKCFRVGAGSMQVIVQKFHEYINGLGTLDSRGGQKKYLHHPMHGRTLRWRSVALAERVFFSANEIFAEQNYPEYIFRLGKFC